MLSKIVYPDRFKIDIVYAFIWVSLSQKGPEIQMMWQIGTIAFGLDKLEKGVTGKEVYYCTKCNQRVSFDTNSQPPRVCKRCGEEFDWASLDKRKVKVCPTCNKEYDLDDVYCEDHTPAVKLQEELH